MKTVNISTLRASLSSILDAVRQGSTVEIIDRTVPIARLVPVEPATDTGNRRLPAWIEKLRRAGVVRVGTLKGVREIIEKRPPGPAHTGAVEALIEDRRTGR
jgi:prevent-host-death family protein